MIELIREANKAQANLSNALVEYIKDTEVPVQTRWECAIEAEHMLAKSPYYCSALNHLVVGGEISWYDDVGADRYAVVQLLSDDFLDHFAVCSSVGAPITIYFEMDDIGMEDSVPFEDGVEYRTKQLAVNEYQETMYCNPIKLKPGVTIDAVKEAILALGITSFTNDW